VTYRIQRRGCFSCGWFDPSGVKPFSSLACAITEARYLRRYWTSPARIVDDKGKLVWSEEKDEVK
jgi:hypothetical protein